MFRWIGGWIDEGMAFVRDIVDFVLFTIRTGSILWVVFLLLGGLVYWRFFAKRP